ncbi:type I restriction-modification system subunit M N-terminal domain-containing protein [Methylomonas denitrificans]|uniref:HsdM-like protein n=2 Tax=Methylomonas methanica TaxID=421 RepID=A0ABY2CMF1_METMH|nr:HsdM-like protein [Methylomonas methanica]
MNTYEFRDYILGFIFYKYLSEKIECYSNSIIEEDEIKFSNLSESNPDYEELIDASNR